jgi:tetraprenyl-beta-curcumene synthase
MLTALGLYQSRVLPAVRHELARWHLVAARIPDPVLRECAVRALTAKGSNPEAIGVFATLAPGPTRRATIHASTALQVAIDYLDSLGEQPGPDPLRDGLQLHSALGAALSPNLEQGDWYAHHPRREDGDYLNRLLASCRAATEALPSRATVLPLARAAALRCGDGQSHTHAAAGGSVEELAAWAQREPAPPGFEWWEIAAGASSSVAAHALIALAATPGASSAEAELIDAAYFPAIGALTVLLDDLVDLEADAAAGEHNYMGYYADAGVAADRLEAIAASARGSILSLPASSHHAAILTGVLAFYLSDRRVGTSSARPIRGRLLGTGGPTVRLLTALLRLQGKR